MRFSSFSLVALFLAAVAPGPAAARAADAKSPPAATAKAESAAASAAAGRYVGTWKGPENSGGELKIALKREAGQWTAEASFTFENTEVPTKTKSVQIDGTKLLLNFTWSVDGSSGESNLTGELAGDKLSGTYKTINETPSSGTWTVTRS